MTDSQIPDHRGHTMSAHTPWTGNLSVDLRKGALSVSADGLAIIDEKGVCWGITFPDKRGHYDHAGILIKAVNRDHHFDALVKALTDILEANKDFRDGMPQNWDGDPLQDACDAAEDILTSVGGPCT